MIKRLVRLLPVSFLALCPALVRAELEASALDYHQCAGLLAASDVPSGRQYAPDRDVQVLHLALEATPDFQQRMLEGKATLQFRPLLKPVRELSLDAVDLNVRSVTSPQVIQGYQVTAAKLLITFAADLPPGKDASVTVTYQAEPKMGLYFRTPEMGYKTGEEQLFTQGEPIEARHWYPCLDAPNHQCTSEITCRVPEGMTVISNGRLVSSDKDAASGLMAFHWTQEQPHANYLISMCAGFFNKIEDNYKGVPLRFYTPPSQIQNALGTFRHTKDILAFFEDEIGVAYPWAKYDQVCVNDFMAGGMENTSATTLGAAALFTDASENIRQTEGLVSHELAHQWFGDLVTCKDWSHLWLNEGFATYYETLYNGHHNGHDAMIYELYGRARMITSQPEDVNAIVRRTYNGPTELFGWLAYQKGSWVLHMLRSQLGEDLFRRCIKTYLERHHHANAVTEDLRRVIEELSGRSYDQFFDQWVFHAHHPELEVSYQWDESAKLAKLAIRQVQRLGDQVLLFNFPLTIRCKGGFGTVDRTIQVMQNEQEVSLALESAPEIVRLDPDYTVLAKIAFTVPNAMLDAQLAAKDDVAGRLLAVEQLSSRSDRRTVGKLQEALNTDAFFGVRLEAAKALRAIHSDAALDALLASTAQADARVRREVVSDVAGFYRESAYQAARNTLEHETNPDILAPAIRALGAYSKPGTSDLLLGFLDSESFHNDLASAAVDAMRSHDDPAYLAPLLASLTKRPAAYTSQGFCQALGTLAYLARNEPNRDAVRDFLISHINSKRRGVQLACLSGLGTLGDSKAIGVLDTFASGSKASPECGAAMHAIAELRGSRRPVDDFKNLRQEILDLQTTSRELRKELDELQKSSDPKAPPRLPAAP